MVYLVFSYVIITKITFVIFLNWAIFYSFKYHKSIFLKLTSRVVITQEKKQVYHMIPT